MIIFATFAMVTNHCCWIGNYHLIEQIALFVKPVRVGCVNIISTKRTEEMKVDIETKVVKRDPVLTSGYFKKGTEITIDTQEMLVYHGGLT